MLSESTMVLDHDDSATISTDCIVCQQLSSCICMRRRSQLQLNCSLYHFHQPSCMHIGLCTVYRKKLDSENCHNNSGAFLPHKVVGNLPSAGILRCPTSLSLVTAHVPPVFSPFAVTVRYRRATLHTRRKVRNLRHATQKNWFSTVYTYCIVTAASLDPECPMWPHDRVWYLNQSHYLKMPWITLSNS